MCEGKQIEGVPPTSFNYTFWSSPGKMLLVFFCCLPCFPLLSCCRNHKGSLSTKMCEGRVTDTKIKSRGIEVHAQKLWLNHIYLKYLIILKHTESEEVEIAAHYWLPATPKCSAAPLHCHVADYSLAICQILGALKDLTPISLSQAVTGCLKTRYPWVHHGYTNPTHGLSFVYSQLQSFTILSHHWNGPGLIIGIPHFEILLAVLQSTPRGGPPGSHTSRLGRSDQRKLGLWDITTRRGWSQHVQPTPNTGTIAGSRT
jgi:hypothetical protein